MTQQRNEGIRFGNGPGPEEVKPTPEVDFLEVALDALAQAEVRLRDLIQAHPVPCVLAALALGFTVARVTRER